MILLAYLIGVTVAQYVIAPSYSHSGKISTLDIDDPKTFNVTQDQMVVMTKIADVTGAITGDEIDEYVSGVYIQQNQKFNSSTGQYDLTSKYYLPVECDLDYPNFN